MRYCIDFFVVTEGRVGVDMSHFRQRDWGMGIRDCRLNLQFSNICALIECTLAQRPFLHTTLPQ
jgi:hypothetical protein